MKPAATPAAAGANPRSATMLRLKRSTAPTRYSTTTVLLVLAAACSTPAGDEPGSPPLPEWTLTETLRIGGADSGPSSFSWIKGIAIDSASRVFIYEHSTQDIRVFNADGTHNATISRRGSGPGELRNAEGIVFAPDGVLWARDNANGRFSLMDAEGTPLHSWPARFCYSQGRWAPLVDPTGRLLDIDCIVADGRAGDDAVLAYHTDRSRVDTIGLVPECGSDALREAGTWITKIERGTSYRQIPYSPVNLRLLAPGDALWCVPNSSEYSIQRLPIAGTDTVRITQTAEAVQVTAEERDSVIAVVESQGGVGLDFTRIPEAKPVIERLVVDDERRLWVQRNAANGEVALDVFSEAGEPLATATLGVLRMPTYLPLVIQRDQLYAVVIDADDVPQVVRFSIVR